MNSTTPVTISEKKVTMPVIPSMIDVATERNDSVISPPCSSTDSLPVTKHANNSPKASMAG